MASEFAARPSMHFRIDALARPIDDDPLLMLDPLPYHCAYGEHCRHLSKLATSTVFKPRPGYSPNRRDYP